MAYDDSTESEFRSYFVRDFPYGTDMETSVLDADITRAIADTTFSINSDLFDTQESYTNAFLLLTAHHLVMNLRASSQGIAGTFAWLTGSKGVGSVSEGFTIPDQIAQNAFLAMLAKTSYGAQYLMRIIPLLSGQVGSVSGGTHA